MALATWSDVTTHLATTHRGTVADAGGARIPLTADLAVELAPMPAGWLTATCAIGGALRQLPPRELLAINARLAIGALCTLDGILGLRQTLPLGALRPYDLDATVRGLGALALDIRRRLA